VKPGDTLANKYVVERVLGQGGMGVVVAARHKELDVDVAIKFLVGQAPANAVERFMREAKVAALVKSEHACRVFDFGRLDSGEPYIVMELLEGHDLAEKLAREGPQPLAAVVTWMVEACDAISQAHSRGIVHRDLKPANLFLQQGADGVQAIKLLDFGISKLSSPKDALTNTAVMMGSPLYMSPEQLESARSVDARSDVWSLGVVMYELLTGKPPFAGETLIQLAVAAREREPDPPSSHRPEIPTEIERIIAKCLAKRPADRYPTVAALVVDLAPYAPSSVAPIVERLGRRATGAPPSDPEIGFGPTVRETPRAREERVDAAVTMLGAVADPAQTFKPVQTTGKHKPAPRSLRPLVLAAGAALAVASAATLLVTRHRGPTPAGLVDPSSRPAPSVQPTAPPAASGEASPAASTEQPHAPPAPADPPLASVQRPTPSTGGPSVHTGSHHPKSRPTSTAAASPAASVSAPPSTAATGSAAAPKRHEIDRTYWQ
jgi:serine/threonine-protein kinase